MKTKFALPLLYLSMLTFGCGESHQHSTESGHDHTMEDHDHHHGHNHAVHYEGKWKMPETMMVYVEAMEKDVVEFSGTDLEEFTSLAEKLEKNIGKLVSNCTMEGEDHEALHEWLVPFMDSVEELMESEDTENAMLMLNEIKSSFANFHDHFE